MPRNEDRHRYPGHYVRIPEHVWLEAQVRARNESYGGGVRDLIHGLLAAYGAKAVDAPPIAAHDPDHEGILVTRIYRAAATTAPDLESTDWTPVDWSASLTVFPGDDASEEMLGAWLREQYGQAVWALFCEPEFTQDEEGVYGDPVPPSALRLVLTGPDGQSGVHMESAARISAQQDEARQKFYGPEAH
jgi:hypothetical protein